MANFYGKLSYSIGNEDWKTEQAALQIKPSDRIICVTASGDRPLNLLTSECNEIVAIDANPIQNHLLELKMEALKVFNFQEYLQFLGIESHHNRIDLFNKVAQNLSAQCRQFWLMRNKSIKKGIIYEGTIEKLCKFLSQMVHMLRGSSKVKKLFEFDCIEKQKAFLESDWKTKGWQKALEICLNPWLTRTFVGDPGLYLSIGKNITPGRYVYDRMNAFLEKNLAKESLLLSLILNGKPMKEAFSPYLTETGAKQIVPRLDRLKTETAHLVDYLEAAPDQSFDCFSLSDVASYLTYPDFVRLVKAVVRTGRPGARFCMRQFLSTHEIPLHLRRYLVRDQKREDELQRDENCFIYRFMVGHVKK